MLKDHIFTNDNSSIMIICFLGGFLLGFSRMTADCFAKDNNFNNTNESQKTDDDVSDNVLHAISPLVAFSHNIYIISHSGV